MKLKDESLQWIYDHTEDLKRSLVVLDYCREQRRLDSEMMRRTDEQIHDLAFSFLMVAMGEHIPKTLWSVDDYSVLYGAIMDIQNLGVSSDG